MSDYTYPLFKDKQWLIDYYSNSILTLKQLCTIAKCCVSTIMRFVDYYDIPKRNIAISNGRQRYKLIPKKELLYKNKEWLQYKYDDITIKQLDIAKEAHCSVGTIISWANKFGIIPRIKRMSDMLKLRYENKEYCEKQRSATIAAISKPEVRLKHSESVKRSWKDNDKRREYLSDLTKERWLDTEYRKFVTEQLLKSAKSYKAYHLFGPDNHNWHGGKSFEPYSHEFNSYLKETIRDLYDHKCFICNKSNSKNNRCLSVHHIDYNKKNNNIYNLVPLCDVCHSRTNGNRRFWIKEFELLLFARKFCMTLGLECEP